MQTNFNIWQCLQITVLVVSPIYTDTGTPTHTSYHLQDILKQYPCNHHPDQIRHHFDAKILIIIDGFMETELNT